MILAITLGWVVARQVFAAGRVTYHRIVGAILLYFLISMIFVALFAIVGQAIPKAFSGIAIDDNAALASNLIYFSFVTLTSTGYGDVVPVHPIARSLCNLESIIGQLYPAILLARLVTQELGGRETRAEDENGTKHDDRHGPSAKILAHFDDCRRWSRSVLAAGVFIVETMPPRTVVMATGAEGGANYQMGLRYRDILAQSGVKLRLVPTSGGLENLALLKDPKSGGWCRVHPGRHNHRKGVARCGVARHRVLRAAVVFLPG